MPEKGSVKSLKVGFSESFDVFPNGGARHVDQKEIRSIKLGSMVSFSHYEITTSCLRK